jgi:hypothetical protein
LQGLLAQPQVSKFLLPSFMSLFRGLPMLSHHIVP